MEWSGWDAQRASPFLPPSPRPGDSLDFAFFLNAPCIHLGGLCASQRNLFSGNPLCKHPRADSTTGVGWAVEFTWAPHCFCLDS